MYKRPSRNKYNNSKCVWNGLKFDSQKELLRYKELLELVEMGLIRDLKRQVKFELIPTQKYNGKTYRSCSYYADFTYFLTGSDKMVVEDVKGGVATQTTEFIIKQKLMIHRDGNEIDFRIV